MTAYKTGEEPKVGDRVVGTLSGKQAVVNDVLRDPHSRNTLVVTYDDKSVPPRLDAIASMYELVERAAPRPEFEVGDRVYIKWRGKLGTVVAVSDVNGASYALLKLGDDGEPLERQSSSGGPFTSTSEYMREAKAIARYHVGDTVSVDGRRGFAKVLGYDEREPLVVRLQWDGPGALETVAEHELTLVRKGEAMFGDKSRIERLEAEVAGLALRNGEIEDRLDKVDEFGQQTASSLEGARVDIEALWEYGRQTASSGAETRERVRKIEAREGASSAGINSLSQQVGNLDRAFNRLRDLVGTKADGAAVARLASKLEALRASYEPRTETEGAKGTVDLFTSYRSVQGSDSSREAISDLVNRVNALDSLARDIAGEVYDEDGESIMLDVATRVAALESSVRQIKAEEPVTYSPLYSIDRERIADLSETVASLSARIESMEQERDNGVVYVTPQAVSGSLSELDERIGRQERLVSQLREQAGVIVDSHPKLGERIAALERRFNHAQKRAKELRKGPKSYDRRLASLEEAVSNLISTCTGNLSERNTSGFAVRLEKIEGDLDRLRTLSSAKYIFQKIEEHERLIIGLTDRIEGFVDYADARMTAIHDTLGRKIGEVRDGLYRLSELASKVESEVFVEESEAVDGYDNSERYATVEATFENGKLVDVVFCEPDPRKAWECLHKDGK